MVLWQPGFDPQSLGGLASTRTYPLRSSFRPTYNMAVNLVRQLGRHTAREVLETSFAQFQADRAVVGLARQLRKNEEGLAGYSEAMTCHLGDFTEYATIRRTLSDREKQVARDETSSRRAEVARAIERLRPGDVIRLPGGRRVYPGRRRDRDRRAPSVREHPSRCPDRGSSGQKVRRSRLHRATRTLRAAFRAQGLQTPGCSVTTAARHPSCGKWRHRAATSARPRVGTTPRSLRCEPSCGRIPVTAARTARSTPGGPSGGID